MMPLPLTPALAADCVVVDSRRRVLMIRRRRPPFQGMLELPGGFVEIGETVESAARRELKEETGLAVGDLRLVSVYSDPERDPRGHTCSVAFLARIEEAEPIAGDDALSAAWLVDWTNEEVAFDHRRIISDALELLNQNM